MLLSFKMVVVIWSLPFQARGDEKSYLETFSKCGDLMMQLMEAPVPVIAAVNGVAAAAGCQLVATCDIVVATERSSFSTPGYGTGIQFDHWAKFR